MKLELFDKKQKRLTAMTSKAGQTILSSSLTLNSGVYYVKVTADQPFDRQYYTFKLVLQSSSS